MAASVAQLSTSRDPTVARQPVDPAIDEFINVETREVSLGLLSDPRIYELEMERVFACTWLMLGHESEIPKAGDYVVRDMGGDQVIVTRDRAGDIHVSLNVCPHRGMRVCMGEAGNAQVHRCIYHGWAFRPNGDFIGAPVEREQMHGDVYDKKQLGLKKARTRIYGGCVWATWNIDGPSFDEFLGEAKWYYDMLFERTEDGLELIGPPQRFLVNANWKAAGEQPASDGFHTLTLHRSLMDSGEMGGPGDSIYDQAPAMYGIDIGSPHGHSLRCIPAELTFAMFAGLRDLKHLSTDERLDILPPPGISKEMLPSLKAKLTPEQLKLMASAPPQVGGMFPNILFAFIYAPRADGKYPGALTLHTYNPKGVDQVEFVNYIFAEKGASEDMKRDMLANSVRLTGTSGTIEQDDADTWPHQTRNAKGPMGKRATLKYQALLGETKPEGWPGGAYVYEGFTKDDTQWHWWMYYRDLMQRPADLSWAEGATK